RVRDVRSRELAAVLWQRTAEIGEPARRRVCVPIDALVRLRGGEAEVRGDVDHARPGPSLRGDTEEPVNERSGCPVRGGAEDRAALELAHQRLDLRLRLEQRRAVEV